MLPHKASYLKPFFYEGVDGLKTGNTDLAGYTFTSTAEKDGRRLITVVMKTNSIEERFKETAKLLDYGFTQFEEKEVFPKGYEYENNAIPVAKGKEDEVKTVLGDSLVSTVKKGEEEKYKVKVTLDESLLDDDGKLTAPVKKGDKIGTAVLTVDDGEDFGYILDKDSKSTVDIVAMNDVEKKNWFSLMLSGIGQFFTNLWDKFMGLF